ncbi:Rnf electron transport complex subunit RnfG [Methanolobus sp. ZRKC3]|uniref:Rnf electron transport complex subunit RnfG n=1 Tax=Methanolobus sp. ZRKC3 TaxID=3125786 RepID=UPI0032468667
MSESSKETMDIIIKMVLISAVAAALLAVTFIPTNEQLKVNTAAAKVSILAELIPDAANFENVEGSAVDEDGNREILYYRATDDSGNIIGYAFFKAHPGAQGPLVVAGGVDASFSTVKGMNVLSHEETPGLGAKIIDADFRGQFNNIPLSDLSLSSDGGAIDSITGATISTVAVIDAMNGKISEIQGAEA